MKVNRPKPKKSAAGVLGVAWYREADWPRVKELFPDADQLHDSYAEWLNFAEASVKRLALTGMTVEPVVIDIDDFLGWGLCRRCSPTPRSNNCCDRLIGLFRPIDAP